MSEGYTKANTPWDSLSLSERTSAIKNAVKRGVYNLDSIHREYNEYAKGGYKPSKNIKDRITAYEGAAMTGAIDPLSGKYAKNNSFEAEAAGFYNALPANIRQQVINNPELADNLFSYSYNVGVGNFKKRVVPALEKYFSGQGSVEDVQNSMWASGDSKLAGLRRRRAEEKAGVGSALASKTPTIQDSNPPSFPTFDEWKNAAESNLGLDIDNSNDYDYRSYYKNEPDAAWEMVSRDSRAPFPNTYKHFPDTYKTIFHPTFSDESMYSGKEHPFFNPLGLVGGHWRDNNYIMSDDMYSAPVSMDDRLWYLIDAENNGAGLRESDGSIPYMSDGTFWGGVLPNVDVIPENGEYIINPFESGGLLNEVNTFRKGGRFKASSEGFTSGASKKYTVKAGDAPLQIAHDAKISLDELYRLNPNARKMIYPGDVLTLPSYSRPLQQTQPVTTPKVRSSKPEATPKSSWLSQSLRKQAENTERRLKAQQQRIQRTVKRQSPVPSDTTSMIPSLASLAGTLSGRVANNIGSTSRRKQVPATTQENTGSSPIGKLLNSMHNMEQKLAMEDIAFKNGNGMNQNLNAILKHDQKNAYRGTKWYIDPDTNMGYRIKNGRITDTFPVMTAKERTNALMDAEAKYNAQMNARKAGESVYNTKNMLHGNGAGIYTIYNMSPYDSGYFNSQADMGGVAYDFRRQSDMGKPMLSTAAMHTAGSINREKLLLSDNPESRNVTAGCIGIQYPIMDEFHKRGLINVGDPVIIKPTGEGNYIYETPDNKLATHYSDMPTTYKGYDNLVYNTDTLDDSVGWLQRPFNSLYNLVDDYNPVPYDEESWKSWVNRMPGEGTPRKRRALGGPIVKAANRYALGGPEWTWTQVKGSSSGKPLYVRTDAQGHSIDSNHMGGFRVYTDKDVNSHSYISSLETDNSPKQENYVAPLLPITGYMPDSEIVITPDNKPNYSIKYGGIQRPEDGKVAAIGRDRAIDKQVEQTALTPLGMVDYTLMPLNVLSPTHTARSLYEIAKNSGVGNLVSSNIQSSSDYGAHGLFTDIFGHNNGIVSDEFAKEHPLLSTAINLTGDIATPIGAALAYNKGKKVYDTTRLAMGLNNDIKNFAPRYSIKGGNVRIRVGDVENSAPRITRDNAATMTPEQWTAAQDAAIARGDMEEAQRLRDLHFEVYAPDTKIIDENGIPIQVSHATDKNFNVFDENYWKYGAVGSGNYFGDEQTVFTHLPIRKNFYINQKNPLVLDDVAREELFEDAITLPKDIVNKGYDGVVVDYSPKHLSDFEMVEYKPNNIKLADAVTYDDNGIRIPLGKRDNFKVNDIRYSILPLIGGSILYNKSNK